MLGPYSGKDMRMIKIIIQDEVIQVKYYLQYKTDNLNDEATVARSSNNK